MERPRLGRGRFVFGALPSASDWERRILRGNDRRNTKRIGKDRDTSDKLLRYPRLMTCERRAIWNSLRRGNWRE